MTCSFCRDAQLRASFKLIEILGRGEPVVREQMERHLEAEWPGRFGPAMKKSLAQNVNTTWTEAGHLAGRVKKTRAVPAPRVAASVYAMTAGYFLGLRGQTLLTSVFRPARGARPLIPHGSPDPGLGSGLGALPPSRRESWRSIVPPC